MKLISALKNFFNSKQQKPDLAVGNSKLIGNTDPICPYCDAPLEKMPGRKKKCPACGEFIYVRTRPNDNNKILIREDQIVYVEEAWAIKNGTHDQFLAERKAYNEQKEELRKKFGREPIDNDIKWAQLNKKLLTHAQSNHWGLYRNARLSMGDILKKESKEVEALDTYLEVCYLDINGPNNCGTRDPSILKEYPPFDPKSSFIAPGVINYIDRLVSNLDMSIEQVEERFMAVASRTKNSLKLPVEGKKAWKKLKNELV